jgi:DegV family protein with EDD domain
MSPSPPEVLPDGTLLAQGPLELLDGHGFARVLRAGALAVTREQETLNRINVFPVPDADTGANLAATFRAAAAKLGDDTPESVGAAARVAADAALDGARGNSGAIVAQFFHGMAGALSSRVRVGTSEFADAAHRGTEAAYKALQNPREGTILSVLRAWALSLGTHSASVQDFRELLTHGLGSARQALANTPRQLEVLARSHVVDAGGQGFVYFLEGAQEWLRGGLEVEWRPAAAEPAGPALPAAAHEMIDERFRYCTEALVARADARPPLDHAALMKVVAGMGESLVVAGGDDRMRVHVHTNEPQRFLKTVAAFGVLERTKIDDMVLQQLHAREASIAIVSDSTCDLPEATAFELGLVRVPLTVSFGDESFLDGVDMTLDGFIRRLKTSAALPTSSQPPVADFRDTYRHLLEYRDGIVSVHIAGAQSGTVQSAVRAAQEVDPKRVRVIDSRTNSVGSGLLVDAVGQMIADGASLDDIERRANELRRDITVVGTVRTLDVAVRGGRVSARAARLINTLHLKPLITFDEMGKAQKGGVALGFEGALRSVVGRVEKFAGGLPARCMIVHTGDDEGARYVAERLRSRLDLADVPVVRSGAVLTAHAGLDSVSVAVHRLRA